MTALGYNLQASGDLTEWCGECKQEHTQKNTWYLTKESDMENIFPRSIPLKYYINPSELTN